MNGLKIISMKVHQIQFIDSVLFLPMPLRKLPEAFSLSVNKSWYAHYMFRLSFVSAIIRW
jgi:hypothetical protein